jgi:hypothetical protein
LTLVNGNNSGVGFEVYTPEMINDWWENPPIGRGTAQQVDCDDGVPVESGECQSPDSNWVGRFPTGGTYYARVTNSNSSPSSFVLKVQGDGVSVGAQ